MDYIIITWKENKRDEYFLFHTPREAFEKIGELVNNGVKFTIREATVIVDCS